MINWYVVETIYALDVLIFGYLFYYFMKGLKGTSGEARKVIMAMTILTGVLFLQEIYFGVNTLTDPKKLAYSPELFPAINDIWVYAKGILTLGGLGIIYTLMKLKK